MIITLELIKKAEKAGACKDGVTKARRLVGQEHTRLDFHHQVWAVSELNLSLVCIDATCNSKAYFHKGKLHRVDGPAVNYADGHRQWRLHGKLHRVDGPAVECSDGCCEWWINGKRYEKHDIWPPKSG